MTWGVQLKFGITRCALLTASAAIVAASLSAQQATSPSAPPVDEANLKVPTFEVVSVKPYKQQDQYGGSMTRMMPDGFTATGVTLNLLLRMAYDMQDREILSAPEWVSSDRYDIKSKIDDADIEAFSKLKGEQSQTVRQQMLQSLLADRFKLAVHHETREWPIYTLVVAKNGSKLQETKPDDSKGGGSFSVSRDKMTGHGVSVSSIVRLLSQQLGRHIIDKTGLTSKYDFTLTWTPEESDGHMLSAASAGNTGAAAPPVPDSNGPSIFTALQEQLGLKLESQKGPVDVLVIDHVEKPTAD